MTIYVMVLPQTDRQTGGYVVGFALLTAWFGTHPQAPLPYYPTVGQCVPRTGPVLPDELRHPPSPNPQLYSQTWEQTEHWDRWDTQPSHYPA